MLPLRRASGATRPRFASVSPTHIPLRRGFDVWGIKHLTEYRKLRFLVWPRIEAKSSPVNFTRFYALLRKSYA